MAEEELTQTGIRVGGWLPAVPTEPDREPQPTAVPRRLRTGPDDAPSPASAGPVDDHAGPTDEPAAGGGADPDGVAAQPVPSPTTGPAPARHSAREGVTGRLAELVGRAAATARVAVGAAPDGPVTRVGVARARRRRRRMVLATVVLIALVLALAYAGRGPESEDGPTVPATLPTETGPAPAPAASPTIVPVTGNPAFPGGPLLSLDQQPVPALVDLTALGARDWIHWGGMGGSSVQRKQTGTGEIADPGGPRLEHAASVSAFAWTDGTPLARQEATRYGVFQRGAGKSFSVGVAGSGDLRTVRLFAGTFSAGARLDVRLSTGGDPAVREVALAAGDRFFEYVIHFRAPRGARLLITWRALTVVGGANEGVTMEALTVS
ncbi:hypothetical protein ACGFI9_22405 [Micromonospora sp. NPDC048930]|uniref:hypothetical protein n=1 Tax=Micromonospora sp. NPDC048930 TaxID=3364261 RepID=UPI00371D8729